MRQGSSYYSVGVSRAGSEPLPLVQGWQGTSSATDQKEHPCQQPVLRTHVASLKTFADEDAFITGTAYTILIDLQGL